MQVALPWLIEAVESGKLSKQDIIRWTFPILIKSKGLDFEDLYQFIVDMSDAQSILEYVLYKSEKGVSYRYLQLASAMIGEFHKRSLPALKKLFLSNHHESAAFVSTACYLEGISLEEKRALLGVLKSSTCKEARLTLVNCLEYSHLSFRDDFLRFFTNDSDDEVKAQAIAILDR